MVAAAGADLVGGHRFISCSQPACRFSTRILVLARTWFGPFNPHVEISRDPSQLPLYAAYSLLRIGIAYVLSLAFTMVYGYVAAYNPRAERIMIPLLDILQSIPVLSFLPGVMLAMVALFPHHQIGVETGRHPADLHRAGVEHGLQLLLLAEEHSARDARGREDLPLQLVSALHAIRAALRGHRAGVELHDVGGRRLVLPDGVRDVRAGHRDFRLPGLGSYLQTAASAGDTEAILWGVGTMIAVIVLLDQIVWRPVIAWAEKFKMEQVESTDAPHSWFLDLMQRLAPAGAAAQARDNPLRERLRSPLRARV